MLIKVLEMIGENCVTPVDGQIVYEIILSELKNGNKVTVDFSGVGIFASSFFNTAIGQLYKDFDSKDLNTMLIVTQLTDDGKIVLKRVIENSKKYYSNEKMRRAQEQIICQQVNDGN